MSTRKPDNHNPKSSKKRKIIKCHIKKTNDSAETDIIVVDKENAPTIPNGGDSKDSNIATNVEHKQSEELVNYYENFVAKKQLMLKLIKVLNSRIADLNSETVRVVRVEPARSGFGTIKLEGFSNGTRFLKYIEGKMVEIEEEKDIFPNVVTVPILPMIPNLNDEPNIQEYKEKLEKMVKDIDKAYSKVMFTLMRFDALVERENRRINGQRRDFITGLPIYNHTENIHRNYYNERSISSDKNANICYKFNQDLLLRAFLYSEDFRKALMSGHYVYYGERLWLFRSDVIMNVGDTVTISKKAHNNPNSFCLGLNLDVFNHLTDRRELLDSYDKSYISLLSNIEQIFQSLNDDSLNSVSEDLAEKHEDIKSLLNEFHNIFTEIFGKYSENIFLSVLAGKEGKASEGSLDDLLNNELFEEYFNQFQALSENTSKKNTHSNTKKNTRVDKDLTDKYPKIADAIIHAVGYDEDAPYSATVGDSIVQTLYYVNSETVDNGGNYFSFSALFSEILQRKNLTTSDVNELTGIPEKTIARMKTKDNYKPTLEYIIICCIALEIMPIVSNKLLYLAGYVLRPHILQESLYISFINGFYKKDEGSKVSGVAICDMILSLYKLPTLTSIIEKNRKDI